VALVAGRNGLGHARRLLQIATELPVKVVHLICTQEQQESLGLEASDIGNSRRIQFHTISATGFDRIGPDGLPTKEVVPSKEVVNLLEVSDYVLSDNSTWAAQYASKFYLFGHFTWEHYWKKRLTPEQFLNFDDLKLEESRVRGWFQIKHFYFGTTTSIPVFPVDLLRYRNDRNSQFTSVTSKHEFWLALGTTSFNQIESGWISLSPIPVISRESYLLHKVNKLPIAVLGRPGLGTIRDCLSAGIPFLPIWDGEDPELSSNEKVLRSLKLIPSFWNPTKPFDSPKKTLDFLLEPNLKDLISEYWTVSSQNLNQAVNFVMDTMMENS